MSRPTPTAQAWRREFEGRYDPSNPDLYERLQLLLLDVETLEQEVRRLAARLATLAGRPP